LIPATVMKHSAWFFVAEAFFGSIFFLYGLSHSSLVLGSTLSSLAPVIAVPIAWLWGLEKLSLYRTLGVVATVFGLWLLVSGAG
jgi:drug/metabolite transporter (DMT)-like permease